MSSADPLQHLGVRTGPDGGIIRVWSEHATAVESTSSDDAFPQHLWSRLSMRQRQLLWLAYAEGFTHEEIAAITGLAPAGIRVLLSRARARFQALQEGGA